jgi:class 3 adenylate cyclase/tetratricopeptide (TPR) repeat protein
VETVRCPSCGEENPAKFRLCGFCGTALQAPPETVICPSCGEENPGKFRLCGFCGTSLVGAATVTSVSALSGSASATVASAPAATAPTAAAPTAQPLPAQEVRKLVTLVFSDLKDSTALTASIDAEAMNEIKARYFASMAAEIERHGGKVEKNIGDAIMAVFGLIRAREDDALRAVRAAAAMQSTLNRLNEELGRVYGVTLTNRTGVNTGEVVANTDVNASQNLATGDAVNVAARLEQSAPANEILIGEITHALVRDHVEVEPVELTLKGKAEPVPAFRLVAVRSAPVHSDAADSPFVGRQPEMDRLHSALGEVRATAVGRLVVVIGDAGVGKTRFIADFVRRVAVDAAVLRGRCLAYGDGMTFWPLVEVVRAAARITEDDAPEAARTKIRGLLPADDPDREAIVDRVSSAVGLSESAFPVGELFWGARKLLESQAAERPLVLVIDDIHSAEATFLEFIENLVSSVVDAPILVVCSARPDLLDEHAGWIEGAHGEQIDLEPLGASDVEAMIVRLLGSSEVSAETREKIVTAAEGNPLYIEQMVSMVRDRGAAAGEIVVPPTIHALLAARLDNLTREERAIVEPASVIGLVFAEPAIEELVPGLIRPTVPGHLADLNRKQFVHPIAGGDDPAFRFHHILVRDAAYGSLLKRARASLHERFVDWAERVNRERGRETEFEEILGYHLEQAVRYRSELGPLDEAGRLVAERAATKLASAGRRGFARGDLPAATNLLRRAAYMLGPDDPVRIRLATDLGEALYEAGEFTDSATVLDEAWANATRIGDAALSARARLTRLLLSIAEETDGGASHVGEEATELLRILEAAGDESGVALGWRVLGVIHATAGRYNDAAEAAHQVVAHATLAGVGRLASRAAAGYATIAMAGSITAANVNDTCRVLLEQVAGDRKAEATILGIVAVAEAMLERFDGARDLHARARTILGELGPSVTAASMSIEGARVAILSGDIAAAERDLRADDAALAAIGEHYFRSTIVAILAHVLVTRGSLEEADEYATLASTLADADDTESQVLWRVARARLLAARGQVNEAMTLADQAVAIVDETENIDLQGNAYVDLGVIRRQAGLEPEARVAFAAALDRYERKGNLAAARAVGERVRELAAI